MKKILLSVAMLMAIACSVQAQKRVSGFTLSQSVDYGSQTITMSSDANFTRNDNGNVTAITLDVSVMGYKYNALSLSLDYGENTITTHSVVNMDNSTIEYDLKSNLSDGLVQTDTYTPTTGKTFSYDYTYTDGHLTEIDGSNELSKEQVVKFTWTDGNITKVEEYQNDDLLATTTIEYGNLPYVEELTWVSPAFDMSDLTEYCSLGLIPSNAYGLATKNLPSKITRQSEKEGTETAKLTYTQDEDNYVTGIDVYYVENDELLSTKVHWEDDPTSIHSLNTNADQQPSAIYNANGQQMNGLTHGMNILRMKDGKTRKIMVK